MTAADTRAAARSTASTGTTTARRLPAPIPGAPAAAELKDVSVEFPRRDVPVLREVSLRLEPGEQLMVFGPSGAGKSTLLQLITGVIPHTVAAAMSGAVQVGGTDTLDTDVAELSRTVGVLAQDPSSAVCLPEVEQELALPLENRGVQPEKISGRIDAALQAVNAGHLRLRKTSQLSGGESQRVALAASLIAEPEILLLDEPTSMLDAEGIASVRDAIGQSVAQYRPALVLVEHRMDEYAGRSGLAGLPARAVVLDQQGRILFDGPTPQVLTEAAPALQERGCWLPLETELQAVFGVPGGLGSETVRARLNDLAAASEEGAASGDRESALLGEASEAASAATASGDEPVLTATDLTVSRNPPAKRRRRTRRTAVEPDWNGPKAGEENALLSNVNLAVRRGEIVALLGANGTGKTSLLLTLAGLLKPRAGDVGGPRPAMVFQNPEHQFVAATVRGEVSYGLGAGAEPLVDRLLREHRLEHLAEQNPFRLSGGEKRRLSVAAMFAHDRPALLADEPTFGLDRRAAIATMRAFRDAAAQGRAIVFSSHDLRTVATLAHRAVVVAEGTVIADGPVFEVLGQHEVLARARITLPPLLEWLLDTFETPAQMRQVLLELDAAVPDDEADGDQGDDVGQESGDRAGSAGGEQEP